MGSEANANQCVYYERSGEWRRNADYGIMLESYDGSACEAAASAAHSDGRDGTQEVCGGTVVIRDG